MDCSPRACVSPMASSSSGEKTSGLPFDLNASRMSTISARAIARPAMRLGNCKYLYLPCRAFWNVSSEGVAEPRTTTARSRCARMTAVSRPL
jgi:hypothetical protein